jgi:uncharacterized protein (DUF305 family)
MTHRWPAAVLLTLIGLAAPLACSDDSDHTEMAFSGTPSDTSPEAGFARDMSTHHAQAVAMAEAIRDRTEDPDLKLLATDIALGQQGQIGRMSGWLDEWGLSISSTNAPMAWITDESGHDGMDMSSTSGTASDGTSHLDPATGLMPGMATRPQISALSTLPIDEAEVSFLQLMIAHHKGGVEMAQAILARTDRIDVVRLATSIVNAQQAEITVMTDMLATRGATP